MKGVVSWNAEKNEWLLKFRGLSFDLVLEAAECGEIVDDIPHHNPARIGQRILVIRVASRHVAVPYITDGRTMFLKTMYYSRDLDKFYGGQDGKVGH
jgi:hypothetical protein